jgi:hypothetical protein
MDNAEASAMARKVASQLRADPRSIDAIVVPPGTPDGYRMPQPSAPLTVTEDSIMGPDFGEECRKLALRLKPNEVGVVGDLLWDYHIIVRLSP